MSHGIYHFLINTEETEGEDILSDVSDTFESYARDHCDENNWYTLLTIVTKDNRALYYSDAEREGFGPGEETDEQKAKRWDRAVRSALDCVAIDMRLFDIQPYDLGGEPDVGLVKLDELGYDELIQRIHRDVPKRLSEAYAALLNPPDLVNKTAVDRMLDNWQRRMLAKHYEMFRECPRIVPFTDTIDTPYDYRAYDLTCGYEPNAILTVDIHT